MAWFDGKLFRGKGAKQKAGKGAKRVLVQRWFPMPPQIGYLPKMKKK
jgi:hypothetical protein